jgi:hypothetical protein
LGIKQRSLKWRDSVQEEMPIPVLVTASQPFRPCRIAALVAAALLPLVACIDLTPPWQNVAGQDDAAVDNRVAGGELDSSAIAKGDASEDANGGIDSPEATGSTDSSADGGGSDASRPDGEIDLPSGADEKDSSADGGSLDSSGVDNKRDDASDGPSGSEARAEISAPPDLGVDLHPDAAPDAPEIRISCATTYYDAKTLTHTDGVAESDGWNLIGLGQFMYATDVTYVTATTSVTVVARGDDVSGAWPTMQVTAEGSDNVLGTVSVASSTMTSYSFTFAASAMTSSFGITVASGSGLHVQSVTISCPM